MGDFLVSCSYDSNASVWACPGFLPIKTLPHQGKLMSLDVSAKGEIFWRKIKIDFNLNYGFIEYKNSVRCFFYDFHAL